MSVRPYPWARLPRAKPPAGGAHALAVVRGFAEDVTLACRSVEALRHLLGAPLEVSVQSVNADRASTQMGSVVSLRIEASGAWLRLEVEPSLVQATVARASRRAVPPVALPSSPSPAMVGAFAAVLAAAVRRAGAPVQAEVDEPGRHAGDFAEGVATANVSISFAGQWTQARAAFPARLLALGPPPFSRTRLRSLGEISLSLPIVACLTRSVLAEVGALREGDVWLLGDAWRLGPLTGPLRGPVWLASASDDRAISAELEASGRLVLRGGLEDLSEAPMADEAKNESALAESVGELPVIVRVEVGAARMKAREWAALEPGDVVALGAKVGGPVILRVNGTSVAEGELVDIDGEVGVRIRRRFAGEGK